MKWILKEQGRIYNYDRDKRQAHVNTVMSVQVPQNAASS